MPARETHREPTERRPRLADLIDLELQLQEDRAAALEALHARDAAIAEMLAGRGLQGRALVLGWLDELRAGQGPSAGERVEELRGLVAAVLWWAGLVVGICAVGGWLHAGTGAPVNVVYFWPAIIGAQLLLLAGLGLGLLPARGLRFVPGLRAAQSLLRGIGAWLPAALGAGLLRGSGSGRALAAQLGELRRLDWVYGRLRFWTWTALTQSFAIGFNSGALLAFVILPYLDDPAFGWRSRLLEPAAVQRIAQIVALPWSGFLPEAVPSAETVAQTRYSSIDPRFDPERRTRAGDRDPWAAWWPFLVASLVVYGLVPRLALWAVAKAAAARELARAPLDHSDVMRVRERLERPQLETRALPAAAAAEAAKPAAAGERPATETPDLASHPVRALCWAGVPMREGELIAQLRAHTGAAVEKIVSVGGLDPADDARALAELRAAPDGTAAVLFVEACEPPVADYTDFLASARQALGRSAPLVVWLVEREGAAADARSQTHLAQWRRQLAALGDPWLRVIGGPPNAGAAPR